MKAWRKWLIVLLAMLLPGSVSAQSSSQTITDAFGNTVALERDSRVVCCHASFAQCWLLSGGQLVGVTQDAKEERGLPLSDDVQIVGTVKHIDLEKLIALEPDYVILSADLTAHLELEESLRALQIPYGYFREDTFEDYAGIMRQFCNVNDAQGDRYQTYVTDVEGRIQSVLADIPSETDQSFLLLRAFSTGMKAKTDDNLAGRILKEFGLVNIADECPSLLEDLSMEKIIAEDPEYVFVITMGDEQAARDYLQQNVESDPAWAGLRAVQNGRYLILPQELFHYKPNDRWDEAYRYLAAILFLEMAG